MPADSSALTLIEKTGQVSARLSTCIAPCRFRLAGWEMASNLPGESPRPVGSLLVSVRHWLTSFNIYRSVCYQSDDNLWYANKIGWSNYLEKLLGWRHRRLMSSAAHYGPVTHRPESLMGCHQNIINQCKYLSNSLAFHLKRDERKSPRRDLPGKNKFKKWRNWIWRRKRKTNAHQVEWCINPRTAVAAGHN